MFYDVYCDLCRKNGLTPSGAATKIGFNRASVTVWKNSGNPPKPELLNKIAEYFGVTTDYLLSGADASQEKAPALTKKDERDIAKQLDALRASLESGESLMFDGDPMSDEAKKSILQAMELGIRAAKLRNKEKYTPKKYRKD